MTWVLALGLYGLASSLVWSGCEVVRHEAARRRAAKIVFPPLVTTEVYLGDGIPFD